MDCIKRHPEAISLASIKLTATDRKLFAILVIAREMATDTIDFDQVQPFFFSSNYERQKKYLAPGLVQSIMNIQILFERLHDARETSHTLDYIFDVFLTS